jgi:uncharacterized protein YjbK
MERLCARFFLHKFLDFIENSRRTGDFPLHRQRFLPIIRLGGAVRHGQAGGTMQQLEIEFKNLLTKEEFERIKGLFSFQPADFKLQENTYFDTEDFALKKMGCALRIRGKEGKWEWTLKEPAAGGLLETTEKLTPDAAAQIAGQGRFPDGQLAGRLKELGIEPARLRPFGKLKTWRAEKNYNNGLLVLDHSVYLNKEDFELEYETGDPVSGERDFQQLLERCRIPRRKTENKIMRFYKEWIKRNEES